MSGEEILAKLRSRPRGGIRLTREEADWVLDQLENGPLHIDRETLRCLIDQAKRTRLTEQKASMADPIGKTRYMKPSPPVLEVRLRDAA